MRIKTSVDRAVRSVWFEDLEEVVSSYEIQSRKPHIIVRRSHQVGIAVYQLAKLRILELYYDFLDRYIDRKDYELIKMDTDSLHVGLSACSLDDVVHPQLQHKFIQDRRTPGIIKPEFVGECAIALCSKCYCMDDDTKYKHSVKGMLQRHNTLTWGHDKPALE